MATHECIEGFALTGQLTRTCELSNETHGMWSGSPPACDCELIGQISSFLFKPTTNLAAIVCPALNISNGRVYYRDDVDGRFPYDFSSIAYFECNKAHRLIGNDTRVCGNGEGIVGEWSGETPMCEGEYF